jgi:hypothetical protein
MKRETRIRNYEKQERCDHCRKWVDEYGLVLVPYDLDNTGEFGVCLKCSDNYSLDYWKKWLAKKREQRAK